MAYRFGFQFIHFKKLLALKSLVPMPYLLVISMKLIARKGFQDVV